MRALVRAGDAGVGGCRLEEESFGVDVMVPGNADGTGGVGVVLSLVAGGDAGTVAVGVGGDSTLVDGGVAVLVAPARSAKPGKACGRTALDAHAAVVTVAMARLRNETRPDTRTILTGYRTDPRTTPAVSRIF